MRTRYRLLALCLVLGIRAVSAAAQGVELSIVKTIDILTSRPRPLTGQTNYQMQAAFNTRDGGCLELAQFSERPLGAWSTPYLLSRFAADATLLRSIELTNYSIYPDTVTEDDDGNVVFFGSQGNGLLKFFQLSPDGSVLNDLPVDLQYTHLIRYQDGFLASGSRVNGFVFLKFSTNLVVEWERRITSVGGVGPPVYPPCCALVAGPAGDFVFTTSGILARVNTNGVVVWDKYLLGSRPPNSQALPLTQILRTSDGGYLLAGYGEYNAGGGSDYLIVKASTNGEHQWTRTYGGTQVGFVGGELLTAAVQTEDGGFLLFGRSDTEEISGNKGVQGTGGWLVKTDERGLKQGEMVIPEVFADASWLIRAGSGFALVGSRRWQNGSIDPQIYRWELSVNRRVRISARSPAGQPFSIDTSTNLATWLPVVVGFSGDLELHEVIGSGNKFWRAYEAPSLP